MTDNLNSQALIPGMGFLQVSFGLGSDDGDELQIPAVFIPDEELQEGGVGRAFALGRPKIGSIDVVSDVPVVPVPRPAIGGTMRAPPKIGSIKLIKK